MDAWVARLREIPDEHRAYVVAPQQAEREFGVDAALAARLVAAGLPHADGPDGPCFWQADLHYLGLRLGVADGYAGVLRRWVGALEMLSARPQTTLEVRCRAYAPQDVEVELVAPGGRLLRAAAGDREALRFTAVARGGPGRLGARLQAALGDLLADLAAHDFCWLYPPLETDLAFVRRTRIANCMATACLLVDEAPRLGVEARLVRGLLLAPPYSTPHNWAEVRDDDGSWVALDPLLVGLLVRFGGLDDRAWPADRSPGAILLALAEPGAELVREAASGTPLEATFLTRAADD